MLTANFTAFGMRVFDPKKFKDVRSMADEMARRKREEVASQKKAVDKQVERERERERERETERGRETDIVKVLA